MPLVFAESVKFIDYEYAGYNYQAYDIGNHFNEFAGTCHFFHQRARGRHASLTWCVFFLPGLNEVDYSHYPDRAFQLQWLRSYLEAYKEHKGQAGEVTDREVEVIYVQVNRFALVSLPF